MFAVPLTPEFTLISLETEIDVTGAKNTAALKAGGGLVTLIDPLLSVGQPAIAWFRQ